MNELRPISTPFTLLAGIDYPIICGAMYPCSNPELVAAVSQAGGIGIIQPLALSYVHSFDLGAGLARIRALTQRPVGLNVIVEKNSRIYQNRMRRWVDTALAQGIRFFITALGNPQWVIERVKPFGAVVFHDVTEKKWADKVMDLKVDGLICVNNRAGGHAGSLSSQELVAALKHYGVPLICAGGIATEGDFCQALEMGYSGVQMGTRFIATLECSALSDYKDAIIRARESDIVTTERVTGVALSVINTPYVEKVGREVGAIARWFFRNRRLRHWIRLYYNLCALLTMKRVFLQGGSTRDYYQAGKSVEGIEAVRPAGSIILGFVRSYWAGRNE